MKLCRCGCGKVVEFYTRTRPHLGYVKGEPRQFVMGHGKGNLKNGQYIYRQIIEKFLGKPLPSSVIIHHLNGNRMNNDLPNLLICQDEAYHQIIHRRQRAYVACGHAAWWKCRICKKWDSPENLYIHNSSARHKECRRKK